MITTGGINTPKTIIFCTSLTDVAKLVSNLFAMLGDALYEPGNHTIHQTGWWEYIMPTLTQSTRRGVLASLKSLTGTIRVVIATTALGMG